MVVGMSQPIDAENTCEALEDHSDGTKWAQAILKTREDIRSGRVQPISADEMRRRLGLDNR